MIFKDKFEEKSKVISPEIDRLLQIAWEKQAHVGDLLLFRINGTYQEDTLLWNKNNPDDRRNPHVIGPGTEGHSEQAHYSFINKYRTTHIHEMNHADYVKQFIMKDFTEEKRKKNDELIGVEETTIQLEMLIYLKFWESDMIIKKFYQFTRALNGQHYDWYFKVSESNRDKSSTGTRQKIIRDEIRDKIEPHSETLYQIITDVYNTQIRNSIAHSNYSFLDRNIHPNNYIKEDPHSNILFLSFDDWIDKFHSTIVLHNEYIRMNNLINEHYAKIASKQNNTIEILVTEKDGKQYPFYLEYRPKWQDWTFKQNR